jgi:dephospho-CoA kinase
MLTIGITGGMGSGKTTICKCFEVLGAPVFYADDEAKILYTTEPELREFVVREFGQLAYQGQKPDRAFIASKLFGNADLLNKLESVIHPLVARRWSDWKREQDYPYVIREAAILIESKSNLSCNEVVLVEAPVDIRINRVMQRSHLTPAQIQERMSKQWADEEKRPFADHILVNDNQSLMMPLILELHQRWLTLNHKS